MVPFLVRRAAAAERRCGAAPRRQCGSIDCHRLTAVLPLCALS